jgi:hypothetical protein
VSWFVLAALSLQPATQDAPSSAAAAPVVLPAQEFRSQHFLIRHDASPAQVRALSVRLEAVHRASLRLARELRVPIQETGAPLAIVYYSRFDDFERAANSAGLDAVSLGYFEPAQNRCVFFDLETHPDFVQLRQELSRLHQDDWARRKKLATQIDESLAAMNERIVQHEAAHLIHANIGLMPPGANAPAWLVEGLAQLFELPFVERGASIALSVNRYRLREFAQLHADDDLLSQLRRMVSGESWRGGADYSLAWALTHYLYVRRREPFAAYVRAVATPDAPPDAEINRLEQFEEFFGRLDAGFTDGLAAFTSRLIARHSTS